MCSGTSTHCCVRPLHTGHPPFLSQPFPPAIFRNVDRLARSHSVAEQHAPSVFSTKLPFNPHNSTRPPRQRLPSSLLIENASDQRLDARTLLWPRHFRSSLATNRGLRLNDARPSQARCLFLHRFRYAGRLSGTKTTYRKNIRAESEVWPPVLFPRSPLEFRLSRAVRRCSSMCRIRKI
jgi:hypothetical protein